MVFEFRQYRTLLIGIEDSPLLEEEEDLEQRDSLTICSEDLLK